MPKAELLAFYHLGAHAAGALSRPSADTARVPDARPCGTSIRGTRKLSPSPQTTPLCRLAVRAAVLEGAGFLRFLLSRRPRAPPRRFNARIDCEHIMRRARVICCSRDGLS